MINFFFRNSYDLQNPWRIPFSLFNLIRPLILFEYTLSILSHVCLFFSPLLIRQTLINIQDPQSNPLDIVKPVMGLFVASIFRTICESQLYWVNRKIDVKIRGALVGMFYSKTLNRRTFISSNSKNSESISQTSNGAVMNIMSSDTETIMTCFRQSHYMVSVPILFILCSVLLIHTVGFYAACAGLGSLFLAIPATKFVGKMIKTYRKNLSSKSDERMSLLSEVIFKIYIFF